MCALYGFINYGKILSKKELKKLVRNLSIASELRGTDLCEYGNMFGVSNEEIMMLYEMGYEDEDIELMMMDHDMLRDCLNEAKECIGVYM